MLVRFTDRDNQGVDRTVIIGDMPETIPNHQGFKANGKIHFGPDGLLYVTIGDYDQAKTTVGPSGNPPALDLDSPVGKMLRVSKESGAAAPGNPFSDASGTDARIFAYGFSKPFDFAFSPQGAIYGVDNTASCEELNLVRSGGNYGWPEVGDFPFSDCTFGEQIKGIHFLAQKGKRPGDFLSGTGVSGLAFVSAAQYPALGDGLLVCEMLTGILRRLVLSGPQLDQVSGDDVVVKDCKRSVAVSPDGTIYYSNDTEIRRLTIQKPALE
jgi:glucose/arabinose dehydrogenase